MEDKRVFCHTTLLFSEKGYWQLLVFNSHGAFGDLGERSVNVRALADVIKCCKRSSNT